MNQFNSFTVNIAQVVAPRSNSTVVAECCKSALIKPFAYFKLSSRGLQRRPLRTRKATTFSLFSDAPSVSVFSLIYEHILTAFDKTFITS